MKSAPPILFKFTFWWLKLFHEVLKEILDSFTFQIAAEMQSMQDLISNDKMV